MVLRLIYQIYGMISRNVYAGRQLARKPRLPERLRAAKGSFKQHAALEFAMESIKKTDLLVICV
jgi:hypothetical protein